MYCDEDNLKRADNNLLWHMDDLQLFHRRKAVVIKIKHLLRSIYEDIPVSRGKKNTYLGMELDYLEGDKYITVMPLYTQDIISSFLEVIDGTLTPPELTIWSR